MTVGPWTGTCGSWHRLVDRTIVALIVERADGSYKASYAKLGMPWSDRDCDDLTAAARCCNAGLRMLGFTCDNGVPA